MKNLNRLYAESCEECGEPLDVVGMELCLKCTGKEYCGECGDELKGTNTFNLCPDCFDNQ